MAEKPHFAALNKGSGSMELKTVQDKDRKPKKEPVGKYQEFFGALKGSTLADNVDQQTGLEFENIEGEVMGVVLNAALTTGSMYDQINDTFFTFESPDFLLQKLFEQKFVDMVTRNPHIFAVIKQSLNELMISFKRQGRMEMVQIAQALSISLQESEKKDPLTSMLGRR
jgi:hypothetical protein